MLKVVSTAVLERAQRFPTADDMGEIMQRWSVLHAFHRQLPTKLKRGKKAVCADTETDESIVDRTAERTHL